MSTLSLFLTAILAPPASDQPSMTIILTVDPGDAKVSMNPHHPEVNHTSPIDSSVSPDIFVSQANASGNVSSIMRAGLMPGRYQQPVGTYDAGTGGSGFDPKIPVFPAFLPAVSFAGSPHWLGQTPPPASGDSKRQGLPQTEKGNNAERPAPNLKTPARDLIDFSDASSIAEHRPIIVAHRGGVILPESHECSLRAIRLAAEAGYDMVELDVQESSDGIPMVFHDNTLTKACGKSGRVADYRAAELESIRYLTGDDHIVRLETALESCHHLGLGVMLDLKAGRDSPEFLQRIDHLIVIYKLGNATNSISGTEAARRVLKHVRFTPLKEEMEQLREGEMVDLRHRFWFGLPSQLQPGDLDRLKSAGALILPAINTFRYPQADHLDLAKADIERLTKEGVDGFQIDSVYFQFLSPLPSKR